MIFSPLRRYLLFWKSENFTYKFPEKDAGKNSVYDLYLHGCHKMHRMQTDNFKDVKERNEITALN